MLLSMSLPALARASDQIDSYSITIVPRDSGKIEVTVNIAGTHPRMTKIGFPGITLYERAGTTGTWSPVSVHSGKYNPNATAGSHTYTFTYQGVAGRNYYTYASFFAQDSLGSDSRTANSPIAVAT
ncbi:MAG: hypothetical protein LBI19_06860 [Oscillospiraceae bacterium]|nr:hypothetical protein [Oscillospiraceae bacterium]